MLARIKDGDCSAAFFLSCARPAGSVSQPSTNEFRLFRLREAFLASGGFVARANVASMLGVDIRWLRSMETRAYIMKPSASQGVWPAAACNAASFRVCSNNALERERGRQLR